MPCPVHGPDCKVPAMPTLGEHMALHSKLREEKEIQEIAGMISRLDHGVEGTAKQIREYLAEQWPWH